VTAETAPWSAAEFRAELQALGEARYHHRHPFNQRLHRGDVSRAELQLWVANRFCYQQAIPRKDAAILSNCPDPEVRRRWIERIGDHDGRGRGEGGLEAWLRLGEAMGVEREALQSARRVVPGVRFAVEAYINFCRTRPWLDAVAASLTELFAPRLMTDRLVALETHYPWIEAEGLQYFRDRLRQAPRDAEYAVALVLERATTRLAQDQALAALAFKCDVLWSLLDAVQAGPLPWTAA
jgi:pyrroloquinoline-quinone synthase